MSTDEIMALLRGDKASDVDRFHVLIELLIDDPKWSDWSLAHLEQAALKDHC